VRVSGPLLERGIDVAKGQRLSVNPTLGRVQVTPTGEETREPDPPALPELTVQELETPDAGAEPRQRHPASEIVHVSFRRPNRRGKAESLAGNSARF